MTKTVLKMAFAVGIIAAAAGCANTSQMKSQIHQAMSKADSAQSTANQAQQTANQALQTANSAQSMAKSNSKRIDRMFKASQAK